MDPISGFFSRVSRSVPFSKKKDPRRGGGPINYKPIDKSGKEKNPSPPCDSANANTRAPTLNNLDWFVEKH